MTTNTKILAAIRALRGASFSRMTVRQGKQGGESSPANWTEGAGSVNLAVLTAQGYSYQRVSAAERAILDSNGEPVAVISGFYRGVHGPGDYLENLWGKCGEETPESKAEAAKLREADAANAANVERANQIRALGIDAVRASFVGMPDAVADYMIGAALATMTDDERENYAATAAA